MKTKQLKEVDLSKERAYYGGDLIQGKVPLSDTVYGVIFDKGYALDLDKNTLVEVIPVAKGEKE